jgi:hypothetical protein
MAEHKVDFHEEIRIAQFWRRHIGEYEYVNHNPEDLQRWYIALETRGPEEIRAFLAERTGRHPMGQITGIVARPPHPSREIVDLWLASHVKTRTAGYWVAVPVYIVFVYYVATSLSGYHHLSPMTALQTNPPPIAALGSPITAPGAPTAGSTLPSPPMAPAAQAATPTTAYSGGASTH